MSKKSGADEGPVYKKIYDALVGEIKNGSPGKISVNRIAAEYGVNRNTADKAINMLERNGWVRRVKRKGTFPVTDNSSRIYSINILYDHGSFQSNFLNSYPFVHAKIIESMFRSGLTPRCNLQMLFFDPAESVGRKREKLLSLGPRSGLIILDAFPGIEDMMGVIRAERIPYISFTPPELGMNTVFHRHWEGSRKAVDYLAKVSGKKKIMFLSGGRDLALTKPRHDAYLRALADNGLEAKDSLVFDFDPRSNESVGRLSALLKNGEADGIFAASFIVGEKVYELMKMTGVRMPRDVALIVFHDIPAFSASDPSVTAVRAPLGLIGETMIAKLVEMIDFGYRDDIKILCDDELLIRGSA